ncbi:HlyD family efflux transporter periplasmic adaptor subunit [Pontibacter sp. JH31]|uniref:HlyD family efflux transporter periplasmic adaptor subunit n=1 Tax=Pontibacter aquaedesilientis TaxID=2766980 RepID=A0ABR7XI93_9BACT|nr:HlyD family efflux transporter periplasmic adaptor subunit [Pontibacter aquaedesilientis]MBD1398010.1 HlyD family efflux transporter periplasmic adaptor subunit [Pontibacter aquaedesilientis]
MKEKDPYTPDLSRKELDAMEMVRTPQLGRTLAYWIGGIVLFLILCLFLPWTQNIASRGTLTALNPQDRPQTVQSTIAGRIERWYVQEGQLVQKGDTIVSLSEVKEKYFDPQLLDRLNEQVEAKEGAVEATEAKAVALENQIKALREGLKFSLAKGRNKIEQTRLKVQSDSMDVVAQRMEVEIAQNQFTRQEALYAQGLKSLTELETRRLKLQEAQAKLLAIQNKLASSRAELLNAYTELNSLQAEYGDKLAKAESELSSNRAYLYSTMGETSKLRSEYSGTLERSRFYQVVAPQTGYLVRTLRAGIGENIKEGEAIATIMPDDPKLAVELYVQPMDLPLLYRGAPVRLQFDGWPALVFSGWPNLGFGTFGGKVAVIDNTATNGLYRMLVVQDPEQEEWPEAIRIGSGVQGWAMLNTVPIWYELWRQLNGFPPDYTGDLPVDGAKAQTKEEY